MAPRPALPDLAPAYRLADAAAAGLCRTLRLPTEDREDLRQELLVDLLARVPAYDPGRGPFAAFARVCIRHAAGRLAARIRRERAERHPVGLDDLLPGREGITLGDTIAEADGYGAWSGQCTDAIAALERRLDLERAADAIDPEDHSLCAALSEHTPHEFGEQKTMPRMRIYRRIREMRLRLLAAGIPSAA
jgi:DNA-directed RNA polymerase specialized sigma24 family protein